MRCFGLVLVAMLAVACGPDETSTNGNPSNPDGSSDDTPDAGDGSPRCGDMVCTAASGETCSTCIEDCACGASDICTGWDIDATCRVKNPLIESMPGTWHMIQVDDRVLNAPEVYEMTVDPTDTRCMFNGQPQGDPGDACIHGLSPVGGLILSGIQLRWYSLDNTAWAEGQVLESGTRIELDYGDTGGDPVHIIYLKR